LRSVAASSGIRELEALMTPIADLALGTAWKELVGRRGEDFHRWRPQSHGIYGTTRKSPWRHEPGQRSIGIGLPYYREAEGLAEETATLATQAMLELAAQMATFMDGWRDVSPLVGGPEFQDPDRH
jgi:hypothetical protein